MNHSFNVTIATKYSVDTALFLGHLAYWTLLNLSNKRNIHDGLCWSFNTLEAMGDIFPYWTKKQCERVINNAVKLGLVKRGNYNKTKYDRTSWYALTPKSYHYFDELNKDKYLETLYSSISPNGEIKFSEWRKEFPEMETPIPDTKPDTKPDTITKNQCANAHDLDDDIKTLKKYEIKPPKNPTTIHKRYIQTAINLLSENNYTLEDYLNYLTNRCPRALLPYNSNGVERQNGFGNILRPSFINDVLNGKWKD